jgi:ribonucleoside-triphosphate reductase
LAAFKEVDHDLSDYAYIKAGNIADYIQETAEKADHELTIEEIQNYVEQGLMSTKRKDVARAYITYRNERTRERQARSDLQGRLMKKLKAVDVANQNANVDERSFGGRAGEVNSEVLRQQALDFFLSAKARHNHLENRVYIHDLDHYVLGDHNCLSIPFDK